MSSQTVRSLVTSDGMQLHFRHWTAVGTLRGIVVCLHGVQSHSGWYDYSSGRMADAGFEVYFADRRGSGLNGRLRGHADHGLRLLNDVRQLVRFARIEHSIVDASDRARVPATLLGLSWGGKIAAAFAATYPQELQRLALLYPGLVPNLRPTVWQNILLQFARRHDLRHKSIGLPLDNPALFTDDRVGRDTIMNDPLALHRVTSGFINSGRDLDQLIVDGQANINHPLLLMLAGRDKIIDNAATRRLVCDFPTDRLSLVNYSDACHTLEFEPNRDSIFDDLVGWLSGNV